MTAFVILDIEVTDPTGYEDYKKLAAPSLEPYGGKYVVRGGKVDNLEGDWSPTRIVMIQFESVEKGRAWINSPEYSKARALRHKYAVSKAIVVEGV